MHIWNWLKIEQTSGTKTGHKTDQDAIRIRDNLIEIQRMNDIEPAQSNAAMANYYSLS